MFLKKRKLFVNQKELQELSKLLNQEDTFVPPVQPPQKAKPEAKKEPSKKVAKKTIVVKRKKESSLKEPSKESSLSAPNLQPQKQAGTPPNKAVQPPVASKEEIFKEEKKEDIKREDKREEEKLNDKGKMNDLLQMFQSDAQGVEKLVEDSLTQLLEIREEPKKAEKRREEVLEEVERAYLRMREELIERIHASVSGVELSEQINLLSGLFEKERQRTETLKFENAELLKKISALRLSLDESKRENQLITAEFNENNALIPGLSGYSEQNNLEKQKLIEHISGLQGLLNKTEEEAESMRGHLKQAEVMNESLRSKNLDLENSKKQVADLANQLNQAKAQIKLLKKEVNKTEENKKRQEEITRLQEDNSHWKTQSEKYKSECEHIKRLYEDLRQQSESESDSSVSLANQLSQSKIAGEQLRQHNLQLTTHLEELTRENETLKKQREQFQSGATKNLEECVALKQSNTELLDQVAQLNKQLETKNQEIKVKNEKISELEVPVPSKQSEEANTKLREEIDTLHAQLSEREKTISALKQEIEQVRHSNSVLSAKEESFEKKERRLRQQIQSFLSELDSKKVDTQKLIHSVKDGSSNGGNGSSNGTFKEFSFEY